MDLNAAARCVHTLKAAQATFPVGVFVLESVTQLSGINPSLIAMSLTHLITSNLTQRDCTSTNEVSQTLHPIKTAN